MNGSEEHADVATRHPAPPPPTPPAAAPPAPSTAGAQFLPPVTAGRTRGLQHKSPVVACLLSLMPGVGQIYVGYYKLGFIHNVVFGSTIAILASSDDIPLIPLLGIFLAFFYIYNIVDAGRRATLYNLALDGLEGIEMPNMNVSAPSFGGSLAGGVALVGVGAILLSNTAFGASLDWVEDWWPAAPILLGVYLLVKALRERSGTAGDPPAGDSATSESDTPSGF